MRTWARKTLSVGVLAAGALLLAPGAAQADVSQDSIRNVGILNGTQVFAPIAVPLNVVGNSIGVAGEAHSTASGINFVENGTHRKRGGKGHRVTQTSAGNVGIANGTQAYLPITVPVNVVGNSAAVLGLAHANGAGVNNVGSRLCRRWSRRLCRRLCRPPSRRLCRRCRLCRPRRPGRRFRRCPAGWAAPAAPARSVRSGCRFRPESPAWWSTTRPAWPGSATSRASSSSVWGPAFGPAGALPWCAWSPVPRGAG